MWGGVVHGGWPPGGVVIKGQCPLAYENCVGGHKNAISLSVFVTKLLNTHNKLLTLNCIRGGTMVPNIWFFGSRILTPQYFGLIIFVIASLVVALLLVKKKMRSAASFLR